MFSTKLKVQQQDFPHTYAALGLSGFNDCWLATLLNHSHCVSSVVKVSVKLVSIHLLSLERKKHTEWLHGSVH